MKIKLIDLNINNLINFYILLRNYCGLDFFLLYCYLTIFIIGIID